MIKETVHSFPVPTPANPSAVYDVVDVRTVRDEAVDTDPQSALARIKAALAPGRNLNHSAVVEEHARLTDQEAAKKAHRLADAKADKEARIKELEALGVPPDHAYLMDTAQFAKRNAHDGAAATDSAKDEHITAYERGLKRALESKKTGVARLVEDLEAREERNAKRNKGGRGGSGGDTLHVSKANAEYNRCVLPSRLATVGANAGSLRQTSAKEPQGRHALAQAQAKFGAWDGVESVLGLGVCM